MKNTEKILSIRGVEKQFGKRGLLGRGRVLHALGGIDLDVMRGEVLSVVGESGSGKSTLGRAILGLCKPENGRITYYGRSVYEMNPGYLRRLLSGQLIERIKKKASQGVADLTPEEQGCLRLLGGFAITEDSEIYAGLIREKARVTSELYRSNLGGHSEELARIDRALGYGERKHKGDETFDLYHKFIDTGTELNLLTADERRRLADEIGIVFQDPYSSLDPRMTAADAIAEGAITHGIIKRGGAEAREYVTEVARRSGLDPSTLSRFPHQFSGGQRQRICIARSLAMKPKLLVLDECISALDVSVGAQIISLLLELRAAEGLTYLFISHDLSVVRYISDRVAVMYLGRIVELGTTSEIFEDPRHPYTVALLSSVPSAEGGDDRVILAGSPPSPTAVPNGCPFHSRCPLAKEVCREQMPRYYEVGAHHRFLCHFPEKKRVKDGSILLDQ